MRCNNIHNIQYTDSYNAYFLFHNFLVFTVFQIDSTGKHVYQTHNINSVKYNFIQGLLKVDTILHAQIKTYGLQELRVKNVEINLKWLFRSKTTFFRKILISKERSDKNTFALLCYSVTLVCKLCRNQNLNRNRGVFRNLSRGG